MPQWREGPIRARIGPAFLVLPVLMAVTIGLAADAGTAGASSYPLPNRSGAASAGMQGPESRSSGYSIRISTGSTADRQEAGTNKAPSPNSSGVCAGAFHYFT